MSAQWGRKALLARMRASIHAHTQRTAVRTPQESVSYGDFSRLIGKFCRALRDPQRAQEGPVALLLDRGAAAYAAMWAAIVLGRAYVALNAKYPASRLRGILEQAGVEVAVSARDNLELTNRLGINSRNVVVAETCMVGDGSPMDGTDWLEASEDQGIAYILFTSGSTGQPKGVPISYDNLACFIENFDTIMQYRADDICSQFCELTFDISALEIYLALLNGCVLCPAREIDLFNPVQFVAKNGITVWSSVPSLARVALRHRRMLSESLATVRLSLFSGEALTGQLAKAWSAAAQSSEIWNNYGPAECTISISIQRWRDDSTLLEAGVVSIGTPFPDCTAALLVDGNIVALSASCYGTVGELLLASPQQFAGYLDSNVPSPFIEDNAGCVFLRTGDRVLWKSGRLYFLNRLDFQVKIGGHLVEIQEVEHHLRKRLRSESLAVIAHPPQVPTELVLFVAGNRQLPKPTSESVDLPHYMLPRRTVLIDALPLTPHGKLDRKALHEHLATGA